MLSDCARTRQSVTEEPTEGTNSVELNRYTVSPKYRQQEKELRLLQSWSGNLLLSAPGSSLKDSWGRQQTLILHSAVQRFWVITDEICFRLVYVYEGDPDVFETRALGGLKLRFCWLVGQCLSLTTPLSTSPAQTYNAHAVKHSTLLNSPVLGL